MASSRPTHDQGSNPASDAGLRIGLPRPSASARIVKKTGVCGGRAIVAGTRIPVWGPERARQSGVDDNGLLERFPSLCHEDLAAAWKNVASNPAEIVADIRENEDA
jgi:uncharacterized protein (DUF433 family)